MNPAWIIPDVPKHEYGKAPPIWIPVVALLLMLVAGIVIAALNWKQGESIASAKFIFRALGQRPDTQAATVDLPLKKPEPKYARCGLLREPRSRDRSSALLTERRGGPGSLPLQSEDRPRETASRSYA